MEDAPFNSTMDTIPNKTPVRLSITIIGQHYCILMSTHETALSMDMLHPLDKETLIGQVSYKQRAKIYNDVHGYSGQRDDKRLTVIAEWEGKLMIMQCGVEIWANVCMYVCKMSCYWAPRVNYAYEPLGQCATCVL